MPNRSDTALIILVAIVLIALNAVPAHSHPGGVWADSMCHRGNDGAHHYHYVGTTEAAGHCGRDSSGWYHLPPTGQPHVRQLECPDTTCPEDVSPRQVCQREWETVRREMQGEGLSASRSVPTWDVAALMVCVLDGYEPDWRTDLTPLDPKLQQVSPACPEAPKPSIADCPRTARSSADARHTAPPWVKCNYHWDSLVLNIDRIGHAALRIRANNLVACLREEYAH